MYEENSILRSGITNYWQKIWNWFRSKNALRETLLHVHTLTQCTQVGNRLCGPLRQFESFFHISTPFSLIPCIYQHALLGSWASNSDPLHVNWHFLTGDEARGHGRGQVVGLELENGRGHNGKWSILRAIWWRAKRPVRKGLQCRAQVRCAREPAYNRRWRLRSGQVIKPLGPPLYCFSILQFVLKLFNALLGALPPNSFFNTYIYVVFITKKYYVIKKNLGLVQGYAISQ